MANSKSSRSYQTKQRAFVLEYFRMHPGQCATIEEVYRNLIAYGAKIGKTTVYRTLAKLVEENAVIRYSTEDAAGACYQYRTQDDCPSGHIHLKCLSCGQLIHLNCDFVQTIEQHFLEQHAFCLDHSKTVLYGFCRQCSK